jgi:hypothetical protein
MTIKVGDLVRLDKKPDGCLASQHALTVGNICQCRGFMGSNIVTTTDEPGETASYHIGRVSPAP